MVFNIGKHVPNFVAASTQGQVNFFKYKEGAWCIFLAHPAAYTPVCTTELGVAAHMVKTFSELNTKLLAVSTDDLLDQQEWLKDIENLAQIEGGFPFPILADETSELSKTYDFLDPKMLHPSKGQPTSGRSVYIIDPLNIVRAVMIYPASCGRNFNEIYRVVESLQAYDSLHVVTPANWTEGGQVMVDPLLNDKDAKEKFGNSVGTHPLPSGKSYLRMVDIKSIPAA